MRRLCAVLSAVFCLSAAAANAQVLTSQAFDPFTGRAFLDWSIPDHVSATVVDDAFRFENKTENLTSTWRNLDFRGGSCVAVTTRHNAGVTDYLYGLSFGGKDYDNQYFFVISADGSYKVGKFEGGTWADIVEWTQSDAIHTGMYAENRLIVDCRNDWRFFVNGVYLGSIPAEKSFGANAGLVVEQLQTVTFDDFFVGQYKSGTADNDFTRKFGALLNDYKNGFANTVGDKLEAAGDVDLIWDVKDPLPGMQRQDFMDIDHGPEYFGTLGQYATYKDAVDSYLKLMDQIEITRTECILLDMGEEVENNHIQHHIWSAVDFVSDTKTPVSDMVVSASIEEPGKERDQWEVKLIVMHQREKK